MVVIDTFGGFREDEAEEYTRVVYSPKESANEVQCVLKLRMGIRWNCTNMCELWIGVFNFYGIIFFLTTAQLFAWPFFH